MRYDADYKYYKSAIRPSAADAATKTDRGCGRRPSRSASRLEIPACCGWCFAHSRGP